MTLSLNGIYARVFLLLSKPTGVEEVQSVGGISNLYLPIPQGMGWNKIPQKGASFPGCILTLTSNQQYLDFQWYSRTEQYVAFSPNLAYSP